MPTNDKISVNESNFEANTNAAFLQEEKSDDHECNPEAIKLFLISQREKLKKSNKGPIEDKYLGEEMLVPLMKTLSQKTQLWAKEDPPRKVTLGFVKTEWDLHKQSWLERFSNPAAQKRDRGGKQPSQRARSGAAPRAPPAPVARKAPSPSGRAPGPPCSAVAKKKSSPRDLVDSVDRSLRVSEEESR